MLILTNIYTLLKAAFCAQIQFIILEVMIDHTHIYQYHNKQHNGG